MVGVQVATAREELLRAWQRGAKPDVREYKEGADINQNNYSGLTYGLLHLHPIFRSMAIHPVIRQVSAQLLGEAVLRIGQPGLGDLMATMFKDYV